jgi:DNA-binding XRE family transcriptional regulator
MSDTTNTSKIAAGFSDRMHQAIRRIPGMTQTQLAEAIGVSRQAMNDIVHGRKPGLRHLPTLAKTLKVDDNWLQYGGPGIWPNADKHGDEDGGVAADVRKCHGVILDFMSAATLADISDFGEFTSIVEEALSRRMTTGIYRLSYAACIKLLGYVALPMPADLHQFRRGFFISKHRISEPRVVRNGPNIDGLSDTTFKLLIGSLRHTKEQAKILGTDTTVIDAAMLDVWRNRVSAYSTTGMSASDIRDLKKDLGDNISDTLLSM